PGSAGRADGRRSRRADLRGGQLVGHRGARWHAAAGHRQGARGADRGSGLARGAEAILLGRRRDRADEPAPVRYLHGKRNEEMGTRGEGGKDQGGVTVPSWLHMQDSAACSTSPRRGEVGSRSDPDEGELAYRKSPVPLPQPSPHWGEGARRV